MNGDDLTIDEMRALRRDRRLRFSRYIEFLTFTELDRLRFVCWRLGSDGVWR